MMRLLITQQNNSKDPDSFKICTGLQLFRVNAGQYPLPANKVSISSLKTASLSTNNGDWTWNLSAAVSEKKKLEAGVYILVASTFEPNYLADFQVNFYT